MDGEEDVDLQMITGASGLALRIIFRFKFCGGAGVSLTLILAAYIMERDFAVAYRLPNRCGCKL